jgi:hypothetical protein
MTGLPFCNDVCSTFFAAVIAGYTSRTLSSTRGVALAGTAARKRPSSSLRNTRILPGSVIRTA